MVMLISGPGKTHFCHSIFRSLGRHNSISINDGVTDEQMVVIHQYRHRDKRPVIICTGKPELMDKWQRKFLQTSQEPIVRLNIKDWTDAI